MSQPSSISGLACVLKIVRGVCGPNVREVSGVVAQVAWLVRMRGQCLLVEINSETGGIGYAHLAGLKQDALGADLAAEHLAQIGLQYWRELRGRRNGGFSAAAKPRTSPGSGATQHFPGCLPDGFS
jgi:hypothetical protein